MTFTKENTRQNLNHNNVKYYITPTIRKNITL